MKRSRYTPEQIAFALRGQLVVAALFDDPSLVHEHLCGRRFAPSTALRDGRGEDICRIQNSGGLELPHVTAEVQGLEGGAEAFERRRQRYSGMT